VQIVVVDDELGVRRLVCPMLAQGGYGTCEAADGAEALASLRVGLAVDLVLSDVAMPQLNRVQTLTSRGGGGGGGRSGTHGPECPPP